MTNYCGLYAACLNDTCTKFTEDICPDEDCELCYRRPETPSICTRSVNCFTCIEFEQLGSKE